MRIQEDSLGFKHIHAYTEYDLVSWKHYVKLLWSVIDYKLRGGYSLTVHLPYELQHPPFRGQLLNGIKFVNFGEKLKEIFKVRLYWENAPWLNVGTWDLKYPQDYGFIAATSKAEYCLDTGHLILGCRSAKLARAHLLSYIKLFGDQIKHVHLHENDLKHDHHWHSQKILTPELVNIITKGRTFIWEKSA